MESKNNSGLMRRSWPAPAKLNLMLRITGRRADGYHELQTVFQMLDFGDEISIELPQSDEIRSLTPITGVSDQDDLTLSAARLLQTKTASKKGALISVVKRLPMGAGLGGGSSNAATVLVALNHLWETELSLQQLADIGLELGADVPVFVHGNSAWAEGVGERLVPVSLPEFWFLVVNPGVHVSTVEVFSNPALTRNCSAITIRAFLDQLAIEPVENVCQPVVFELYPVVREVRDWLSQRSDSPLLGMTGTGSSVFAAFAEEQAAASALGALPSRWSGFVAKGVNISPLHAAAKMC